VWVPRYPMGNPHALAAERSLLRQLGQELLRRAPRVKTHDTARPTQEEGRIAPRSGRLEELLLGIAVLGVDAHLDELVQARAYLVRLEHLVQGAAVRAPVDTK